MSAGKGGLLNNRVVDWVLIFVMVVAVFVLLGACSPKQAAQGGGTVLYSIGVGLKSFLVAIPRFVQGMNDAGGPVAPAPPKATPPKATQAAPTKAAPAPKPAPKPPSAQPARKAPTKAPGVPA